MALFKNTEYTLLETDRLLLIELAPPIMTTLFTRCSDEEIVDFLCLGSIDEVSVDRQNFAKGMVTYRTSYSNFILIEKQEKKFIGRSGFHMWYILHARAEIGYAMNTEDYMRKGYMSEAVKAILEYGFATLKLNRVEAFVGAHNPASLRLLEKFGFTLEGNTREHFHKDGVIYDSLCFSLLSKEYYNRAT